MRRIDTDLWVSDAPLRFLGLEVGARMTVVRLPDGRLFLHSPIAASDALVAEVKALGPVAHLVAPNRFHHLFVADWKRACPEAALYAAPGLDAKRGDLPITAVLGDAPEPAWKGALEQVAVQGVPFVNEVVFFHRPSASLILTDLAFNVGESSPVSTRLAFRLMGKTGELAPTLLERLLARDRAAFRASLERILAWPFERVIVTHGDVCERGGREQLARNYAWLRG